MLGCLWFLFVKNVENCQITSYFECLQYPLQTPRSLGQTEMATTLVHFLITGCSIQFIFLDQYNPSLLDLTVSLTYTFLHPIQDALIQLGAKYAPCMRKDKELYRLLEKEHQVEAETGCCIGTDQNGCIQKSQGECKVINFLRV